MHLMQLAVFVLYSIHIKSEQWLPFFKIVMNKKCDPLWMWSEDELKDLQDEKLIKRVFVWKEVVSQLAANIAPKLNSFGLFAGSDIEPETLVRLITYYNITYITTLFNFHLVANVVEYLFIKRKPYFIFQVHTVCAVQSSSINITSDTGHPVRTLVPVSLGKVHLI